MLVFSCVPAFANGDILVNEGYNIDCVPYSPYISSLVVTDNTRESSVYYSSSKARTYSATASTFSASSTSSDTSTDYLYSFHDMWKIWSFYNVIPNHGTGAISIVTDSNGYRGLKFNNKEYTTYNTFDTPHGNTTPLTDMKAGNKYSVSFTVISKSGNWGEFVLYLFDSADTSKQIILYQKPYSTNMIFNQTVSATVIIPDDWSGIPVVRCTASRLANTNVYFTLYVNDFTITDITNENLDKSLDKFGDRLENAGSNEPPLDTDISAFQSAIDTMNGWIDQLNVFADSIDSAGETVSQYISKGTELFNGFMGIAPASVIALVAFGVVFLVIRKIVGR